MFGLGKVKSSQLLSCFLSDYGYSLIGLKDKENILFVEEHYLTESSPTLLTKYLAEDVSKHDLAGSSCQVILSSELYQLFLVDAPDVPENELSKALRWQLKGLVEYPLNDLAVDAFIVPTHGAGEKRRKAFAAVTLQSALINKISMMESCLLNVFGVSISELSLGKLLCIEPTTMEYPSIVISYENEQCRHHVYFKENLYLFRTLPINKNIIQSKSTENQNMLLEIQRSIDYCLMELKIPEPKQVFFSPSFYKATALFNYLQTELNKEVNLLNINSLFKSELIAPEIMAKIFYAIGGGLMLIDEIQS